MQTLCNDRNGISLRVDSRPDLSGNNPGGTICEVYVRAATGWAFSRTVTVFRNEYSKATLEGSIALIMKNMTFK